MPYLVVIGKYTNPEKTVEKELARIKLPDFPVIPPISLPKIPSLFDIPTLPKIEPFIDIKLPEIPVIPPISLPQIPKLIDLSGLTLPTLTPPAMPSLPGFNIKAPELPSLPSLSLGVIPPISLPKIPKLFDLPELPSIVIPNLFGYSVDLITRIE
jgi:hypothetical protein